MPRTLLNLTHLLAFTFILGACQPKPASPSRAAPESAALPRQQPGAETSRPPVNEAALPGAQLTPTPSEPVLTSEPPALSPLLLAATSPLTEAPTEPAELRQSNDASSISSAAAAGAVDPILEWNAHANEVQAIDHTFANPDQAGPTRSSRAMAIVHLAMYDAYNAVHAIGQPYLAVRATAYTNAHLAASMAAYVSLRYLYPSQAEWLDNAIRASVQRYYYSWPEYRGLLLGRYVARLLLWTRTADGSQIDGRYQPQPYIGFHNVDPLNPGQGFLDPAWGQVRPFALPNTTLFRAPPPPSLKSGAYATAYNEVKSFGGDGVNSPTLRSEEQTIAGIFWAYDGTPNIGSPVRLYNQIVRTIAVQKRNSVGANARLFALANMAMADAAIQAWSDKYKYILWRPILGVRYGEYDENDSTRGDPRWTPLGAPASNTRGRNFTPNFPSYTSGHAVIGTAAMRMIANFYGTQDIAFDFISDEFNGRTRDAKGRIRPIVKKHFPSLTAAIDENAASRIYLGIHWRFDAEEGIRSGYGIADYIASKQLRGY